MNKQPRIITRSRTARGISGASNAATTRSTPWSSRGVRWYKRDFFGGRIRVTASTGRYGLFARWTQVAINVLGYELELSHG